MPQQRARFLFVSDSIPENVRESTHGIFQRMRLFLDALAKIGELQLLFYVPERVAAMPDAEARYTEEFERHWNLAASVQFCRREAPGRDPSALTSLVTSPFGSATGGKEQVAALSRSLETDLSAVIFHRLSAAYPLLRVPKVTVPVLFDLDDVEHVALFRSVLQPPVWASKLLWYCQLPGIISLERRIAKLSYATFVCSSRDARYLRSVWRIPRVVTIPNAVDIPLRPEVAPTRTILFVGRFSYPPNAIAADYLVKEIWRYVRAAFPDAQLLIVGAKPECIQAFHHRVPGVQFLGFVSDLAPLYARAGVVCCPIRSGSGTRVKIIEAASFGNAIVSTTLGAEGLEFEDGKEILLRDDSETIAAACVALLTSSRKARDLGLAARRKAEQLYDRKNVIDRIRGIVSEAIAS